MIAKSADVAEYYPLTGADWLTFKSKMTGLVPTSERFDEPHCLLEAVLRESAGAPGTNTTFAELAALAMIPASAIPGAIEVLTGLGIVRRFFDASGSRGERIFLVLAHHPAASRVFEVMSRRPHLLESNPELRHWANLLPEPNPEPDLTPGPRPYIPFDEGLGRLFRLRDLRRGTRSL